MRSNDTQKLGV